MKAISIVEKISKWFSNILMYIAGILAFLLMVVIVSDVLSRAMSGHGFQGAVEYTEVLLVGMVFLAWAAAQRAGTHVAIDLLYTRLKPVTQRLMLLLGLLVVIVCLVPLTVLSLESAVNSFVTGEFRIGISSTPVWPARFAVALGMIAVIFECLTQLLTVIGEFFSDRTREPTAPEPDTSLMV